METLYVSSMVSLEFARKASFSSPHVAQHGHLLRQDSLVDGELLVDIICPSSSSGNERGMFDRQTTRIHSGEDPDDPPKTTTEDWAKYQLCGVFTALFLTQTVAFERIAVS